MKVIEASHLKKSYGRHEIIKDVSFNVSEGEAVALLGPNGAGKTTIMNLLLGLTSANSGQIKIFNKRNTDFNLKHKISCTPQNSDFPENVKVGEVIDLVRSHYQAYNKKHSIPLQKTEEILEKFKILKHREKYASILSGGEKRSLSIACAMLGEPKLLVLDEPTVALDVEVRNNIWSEIIKYKEAGRTLFFTTHYLDEAELLADRIIVLNKGHIIKEGLIGDIKKEFGYKKVQFKTTDRVELPNHIKWESFNNVYKVFIEDSDDFVKEFVAKYKFYDLQITPMKLEDVFIKMIEK